MTTIAFSKYPLSRVAFALGAVSLLSGLIATGLGTGLICVLEDIKGSQYQVSTFHIASIMSMVHLLTVSEEVDV